MNLIFDSNGWQAVMADHFTFANLELVTQAICNYIRRQQSYIDNFPPRLVVGYDSRFMGEYFAQVAAKVIAQNSLDVFICDRAAPTPVISWAICDKVASAAIVITGANESSQYNGVKFITSHMAVASESMTQDIEFEIANLQDKGRPMTFSLTPGDKESINPKPAYFQTIKNRIDLKAIADAKLKIKANYLNGITSGYLQELLREVGGKIDEVYHRPLPDFGHWIPALTQNNTEEFSEQLENGWIGLIFDGDGSSVQVFDGKVPIAYSDLSALILWHLLTQKQGEGSLIKPCSKGDLDEKVAKHFGCDLVCSKTADFREITPLMVQELAILVSDQLGGFAFQSHIMERDGILAALYLLELCAHKNKRPLELIAELKTLLHGVEIS